MSTIIRTTSSKWKAIVRRQGWPSIAKTFRLKRDAIRWSCHIEDQMTLGAFSPRVEAFQEPFDTSLDRYMREVSPTKSPKTHTSEQGRAKHLSKFFSRHSLSTITPDQVAAYRDSRLAAHKSYGKRPPDSRAPLVAPPTVRLELALLSHLFLTAIREWRVGLVINPVSLIRRPRPAPGRSRRFLAGEEQRLAIAARNSAQPCMAWMIGLALATAMREGEILRLKLSEVDLQRRTIHLSGTKNGDSRTVPLTRTATRVLTEALATPDRPAENARVFFGQHSRSDNWAQCSFWDAWDQVRERAGLIDFRFHDLRHEAISRLVEAGLSDQEVASISGHRSMQMLHRYTHLRAEGLVARLDRLERLSVEQR